jgi:ATP-binding cassette subfamily B (MDR/TAP) protein 1
MTTIVITHDLSQIGPKDFVYVLKDGRVVEQGFRSDLELVIPSFKGDQGEFRKMMESQRETGGFLPEKRVVSSTQNLREAFQRAESRVTNMPRYLKHQSMPLHFGACMLDVVADLTGSKGLASPPPLPLNSYASMELNHGLRALPLDEYTQRRPYTTYSPAVQIITTPPATYVHQYSLPSTATSATLSANHRLPMVLDNDEFDKEKTTMKRSAVTAREARSTRGHLRRWGNSREEILDYVKVEKSLFEGFSSANGSEEEMRPKFWALMRSIYPTVPRKSLLFFGLIICVLSGAMTPVFSYLLSRLLFEVSIGAQNVSTINTFGGLVLGVAAVDGFFLGLKYFVMETSGMLWVTHIRKSAFSRILEQDKKWFDKPLHAPARIVQILVRDGEDARDLISVVWGQFFVVATMLGVGLVWAFIRGWQLTLAGLAIGPVFAITMAVQTKLVAGCEVRNKRAREDVARDYYDVCDLLLLHLTPKTVI